MFEKSKRFLGEIFGNSNVYSGPNDVYIKEVLNPLMIGGKNNFNPSTDAEKMSTVITCIKILSDTISRLPVHVYSDSEQGHLPERTDYRYPLLHYSPDDIMTSQTFFSALEFNRNLKGNSFALIGRNPNTGLVNSLHFIPSSYIGGYKIVSGEIYYIYYEPTDNNKTKEKLINYNDILHFKMTTKNGYWGINPIEAQRTTLSTIWKAKQTVDSFYENNAFSPKVLKSTIPDAAFQKTVIESIEKFKKINRIKTRFNIFLS